MAKAKNRFGVPVELAEKIERLLPGGENRVLRLQLRQAARVILAWDDSEDLLTVAPLTTKQAKAKETFVEFFNEWFDG